MMIWTFHAILFGLLFVSNSGYYSAVPYDYPFQNVSLPFEKRVEDLVMRLSLSELVGQMAHGGASNNGPAPGISRLGIKPYQWGTECLDGDVSAGDATSFPMAIGLAASFNYDLLYGVANATSCEVRAKNIDATSHGSYNFHTGLSCWSPVLNIMRDPRWGRNQETYGEDPWFSGYLAHAFVTGLQGNDSRYVRTNAGCKHFDVHGGPETIPVSRFSFDAKVSDRDWRMTFLPAFRSCVEAGSWSLMCSYNSINGVPACANSKLLTDILRNEWNFKGYVVSDQGALENIATQHHYTTDLLTASVVAAKAGTCLEDGNNSDKSRNTFANLEDAVNKKMISIGVLKDAVSRLFMVRMKLGEFDPPDMNPYSKLSLDLIQSEEHRQLSVRAALESLVLLKNSDKNGLPINSSQSCCIVGPFIDNADLLFGDYSPTIMPKYVVTPLAGLMKYLNGAKIKSSTGCDDGPQCNKYDKNSITSACSGVDTIIIAVGTSKHLESEGHDRADMSLPSGQLQLIKDATSAATSAKAYVVLFNAGPVDISWALQSNQVGSIIEAFFPAQAGGEALGMVFAGKYSPAGRLPFTWPANISQIPDMTNYSMAGRTYRYFTDVPMFPFGYGLSYASFSYSDLKLSSTQIKPGDNLTLSVNVKNIGNVDGDEVTQVYLMWDRKVVEDAPIRQLVGTKRNFLKTNQQIMLDFSITTTQMQVWTTEWTVMESSMSISVGGQQPDQMMKVPSNVLTADFVIKK